MSPQWEGESDRLGRISEENCTSLIWLIPQSKAILFLTKRTRIRQNGVWLSKLLVAITNIILGEALFILREDKFI